MKVYAFRNLPYERYLRLAGYFRNKRKENLLFCEHDPVITCGIQFREESLKFRREWIEKHNIHIYHTKRGGDVTAHEPGQIVIYPHIDLKLRKISITQFIKLLTEITEKSIKEVFDIVVEYNPRMPGLYTIDGKKLVSIGLEIRNGFTSSGLAMNYSNDLQTFSYIHPCGIKDLEMISIKKILEQKFLDNFYGYIDTFLEEKKSFFLEIWQKEFLSRL